jgi:hypothetical protein
MKTKAFFGVLRLEKFQSFLEGTFIRNTTFVEGNYNLIILTNFCHIMIYETPLGLQAFSQTLSSASMAIFVVLCCDSLLEFLISIAIPCDRILQHTIH